MQQTNGKIKCLSYASFGWSVLPEYVFINIWAPSLSGVSLLVAIFFKSNRVFLASIGAFYFFTLSSIVATYLITDIFMRVSSIEWLLISFASNFLPIMSIFWFDWFGFFHDMSRLAILISVALYWRNIKSNSSHLQ
jgi:hypothetical protein